MALTVKEYARLTPEEFGDDYEHICEVADLPPIPGGYGLYYGEDDKGRRVTAVTTDLEYHQESIKVGNKKGVGFTVSPDKLLPGMREGWPDEWGAKPS